MAQAQYQSVMDRSVNMQVWYEIVAAGEAGSTMSMREFAKMMSALPMFIKDGDHALRQHIGLISKLVQDFLDSIQGESKFHIYRQMTLTARDAVKKMLKMITAFFRRYGISFEVTAEDEILPLEGLHPLMDCATLYNTENSDNDEDEDDSIRIDKEVDCPVSE